MTHASNDLLSRFDGYRDNIALLALVAVRLQAALQGQFAAHVQTQRALAHLSLLEWMQKFLPHYVTRPPSLMHRWLETQFASMAANRGTKLNVIGPRGAAKSTIGALAWPLRLALEGSEAYIWIVSDTKEQARSHLDNLRSELLDNEALAAAFPHATGRGPVWRENSLTLNNGVVIEAFGSGQRIRGRRSRASRPTLIVCDDLQNDQHIESAVLRMHARAWFHGMLLKAGNRHTNFLNLATALHVDAIALELSRTPGWTSRTFRAIERWPENMDRWAEWKTIYTDLDRADPAGDARRFYEQHRAELEVGAELLWPEEEDLYTLMRMRAESGESAFEREKQGSPLNPELCEWPEEYFTAAMWFDDWPQQPHLKTLALDPSKGSESRHGDYSAFVLAAIDGQGVIYVEADLKRRPTPQMVADGVELVRRFQPDVFGIEANQFQDLLAPAFVAEFQRQGLLTTQPQPLVNTVNKLVRIRRLGPLLSSRRLRFKANSPSTQLLVQQLKQFPLADHDDGPDALEMALRLAESLLDARSFDDGLGTRFPLSS